MPRIEEPVGRSYTLPPSLDTSSSTVRLSRYSSSPSPSTSPSSLLSMSSSSPLSSYTYSSMQQQPQQQHIWIITGPAGCGKTTIAQGLADHLDLPYIEGDDYHPPSNKEKMAKDIPLTDADRWDWLIELRETAVQALTSTNHPPPAGVVVTCSALKHKYRDVIRVAGYDHPAIKIHFLYLRANEETIMARVRERKGHFMKWSMVHSQFEMLEEPRAAEWDALTIDCSAGLAEVRRRVDAAVQRLLDEYK